MNNQENSLKNRFKELRQKLHLTQKDLADAIDCTDGKIKQIEIGKTLSIKYADAKRLELKYGVNTQWLMDGTGDMLKESAEDLININIMASSFDNDLISIPFYKDISASAGGGCTNEDCKPTSIRVTKDFLPTKYDTIEAIKVMGDSMEPTINDGDVMFLDKNSTEIMTGKIYIVMMCGEVYVKRIFITPDKKVILKPDNTLYPQLDVVCEDFKVIGRVVGNMNIKEL